MSDSQTTADLNAISLPARIAALEVGQCVAMAERFPLADATPQKLADAAERLENTGRSAIIRAKAKTGHAYKGEETECFTTKRDPVILLLITRTA